MKAFMPRPLSTLRGLFGLHVGYDELLAYRDGELGHLGRWCVETHLRRCEVCSREAMLIEKDLRRFKRIDKRLESDGILELQAGLAKLRLAIVEWESGRQWQGGRSRAARDASDYGLRQLATEFNIYLGDRATAALLLQMKTGVRKHADALLEAESVLRDFLGPGAAAAIAQRISYIQAVGVRTGQSLPA
jgi:anti-sigma factor RsiW